MMARIVRQSWKLGAVAVLLVAGAAFALPHPKGSLRLKDLSWMAGAWRESGSGGLVEEHWSEPADTSMLGMCRLGSESDKALYEIILIEEKGRRIVMSILHYKSGLKCKDLKPARFTLVDHAKRKAVFEDPNNDFPRRITYTSSGGDELTIRLEGVTKRDEKPIGQDLKMRRLKG